MELPNYQIEESLLKEGVQIVAGMDEVGRGAGFGPLVVAVVVLSNNAFEGKVNDSKLLSKVKREKLAKEIKNEARGIGIGVVSAKEINKIGLSKGLTLAGERALKKLDLKVDVLLLDGKHNFLSGYGIAVEMVTKGDRKSISIASASIVAKVERDSMVLKMSRKYPGYNLESNMGYATPEHKVKVKELGATLEHRSNWGWDN